MPQNDTTCDDSKTFAQFCSQSREIQHFRSKVISQTILFFNKEGYMFIDPPLLHEHIANRKKGITVLFGNIQYDLNASNALYISVYATIYGSVFDISPTFRQEKNLTIILSNLECWNVNLPMLIFSNVWK